MQQLSGFPSLLKLSAPPNSVIGIYLAKRTAIGQERLLLSTAHHVTNRSVVMAG